MTLMFSSPLLQHIDKTCQTAIDTLCRARAPRVNQTRGNREAVACCRRVLEIIDRTPDDFDPEYTQRLVDRIAKLDQPQAP